MIGSRCVPYQHFAGDKPMSEPDHLQEAQRLFRTYARVLNAEFYEQDQAAEQAHQECVHILDAMRRFNCTVVAQIRSMTYTVRPSVDTVQSIVVLTYYLALVPIELRPYTSKEAVLEMATAQSRIYGPIIPASEVSHTQKDATPHLTPQNEAWLHSILDPMSL